MLDYWIGEDSDIYIICPAEDGYEGQKASPLPGGKCVFHTPEGLCELHNGFKPIEGRLAHHRTMTSRRPIHESIASLWDSDEGREVVEMWKDAIQQSRKPLY